MSGVSVFARWRIFQKVATGIFVIFMGLMVLVCIVAYSRKSGTTRQDMAQAQFVRLEAVNSSSKLDSNDAK